MADAAVETDLNRITFELTDDQRELVALARDFALTELRPAADRMSKEWTVPTDLLAKAGAAGLVSYAMPESLGGGGVDPVTASLVMEELTFGDPGLATLLGSAHLFAGGVIASGASDAVVERWVRPLTRPEGAVAAIAFSEPHAGSDVAAMRTRATRDGDGWRLSGEKTWITGAAPFADAVLVFARTDDPEAPQGASGISTFVVPADAPGVSFTKLDLMGLRTSWTGSMFLDDVHLDADQQLGELGDGFHSAMRFFTHSRPQVASAAVGIARAAFEYAVEYAREREAFGKPIIHNQGVSFLLADMGMRIEAARALVLRACDAARRGEDVGLVGSYAKAFASDVAMQVTTDAVQVLGGAGLATDHPVERWMRDAKVLQIVEGTNQIQRLIASRYYSAGVVTVP